MCFSASASFTASAVLMPLGLYSVHIARSNNQPHFVPLALTPFFFGVQQLVEGLEWTGIDNGSSGPFSEGYRGAVAQALVQSLAVFSPRASPVP